MKKWDIISSTKRPETLDQIVDILLQNRGITTKKDRDIFLHPTLESVTTKSVGVSSLNLKKMLDRLESALINNEKIIIYGDYDVDGITGTAILWETLISLGFDVMPYIPHRTEEGYGLSKIGIVHVKEQMPETKLIITVDNGIVAHEAVDFAKTEGLDVIITDHHMPDTGHKDPAALAVVHTLKLCGAGLAWLISKDIQKKFGSEEAVLNDTHLELAALGTIADMVPLTHANRAIVYHGLRRLSLTDRFGLQELYRKASISTAAIGVYEVGHVIAPRLNASGRLETAMDSLRLLCTKDKKRAALLAEKLENINSQRQKVMKDAVVHASDHVKKFEAIKKILVIASESYPEGVIGLVAGKLVQEYHRPSLVIAIGEKTSKGSARSVSGFNLIEFLRSQQNLFINVGGHPMAAGFTIFSENIEKLQSTLENSAEKILTDELLQKKIKIDLELPLNEISEELYMRISELSPFGMGNFEPLFLSRQVLVREKRLLGKDGSHLRLILQGGELGKVIEAVAFGMGMRIGEIAEEGHLDVVYTISINEWNGNRRLQIKILDFKLPNS